jgi:hypothetical protein
MMDRRYVIQREGKDSLCECGCGEPAPVAKRTDTRLGWVKGQSLRFIRGHATATKVFPYRVEDRGYSTPCWIWQRYLGPDGYGQLSYEGRRQSAHRVFYLRHVGPVPDRYDVDHLCRVRSCVNPDHLEAVTRKVNCQRSPLIGRWAGRAA